MVKKISENGGDMMAKKKNELMGMDQRHLLLRYY